MINLGQNEPLSCRLCGSEAHPIFELPLLQKYHVNYYLCTSCKSLQTEEPYWLHEAYSADQETGDAGRPTRNLNDLDTGAAQRNLTSHAAAMMVAKCLGAKNIVDHGGGDGLLCRLLRDHGLNAYVTDPHASPTYAPAFTEPDFESPDLMTAFEVFEHLSHPREELASLFSSNPTVLLATTLIYSGQSSDWWYLIPETGHHVFFYSEHALHLIASRHGYEFMLVGEYILFAKPGHVSTGTRKFLKLAMRSKALRLYRSLLNLQPALGFQRDHDELRRRMLPPHKTD